MRKLLQVTGYINDYCSYSTFLTADDFACCIHIIAYFELFSNF